ncbi:MAG TPA: glycosyltransferase family 4 protein, partial [Candidatus Dormibacteraeota bacterium]|nr:glycosyltransferase family 4 protein [Candidatus Dormibacteraeota bacterium]
MKKEIFILTTEPPEVLGGMETFIREQIRGFKERAYSVRIFHRGNSGQAAFLRFAQRTSGPLADALLGWVIGNTAQQAMHQEVAAVISHGLVGWYPLRVPNGCKEIHFYHGTYRAYAELMRSQISLLGYWKMKWWDTMLLTRLSGRNKIVFSNSQQVAEEVRRFFGYESHVVSLLATRQMNPLDPIECRRRLGLPIDAHVGVFVGSLHPMKNFPMVCFMIQAFPDVHWIIALRGNVADLDVSSPNTLLIRNVPSEMIPQIFSAADFSLCPSVYEPFGYVIPEALACGTPVIAAPGGASSLFLSEPPLDRLLVRDSSDREGFLAAVREVLTRKGFYRQLVL